MEISRLMHDRATAGAWDEVGRLETQRAALLRAALADGLAPEARPDIETILDLDARTLELGRRQRDEWRDQLDQLQHGHRALQAYRQTAPDR